MRFRKLDLNLLVALNALLLERSVSSAAERCFLTQSAMSHALGRLRQHFNDELLVASGRQMLLTPRAEELVEPVGAALRQIDQIMNTQPEFDPATASRHFTIHASDYALSVGLAAAIAGSIAVAPGLEIDITPPTDPQIALERGNADLVVLPKQFLAPNHPSAELYRDEYVVVMCRNASLAHDDIDIERYFTLDHVAVRFAHEIHGEFAESRGLAAPQPRRVVVAAPSFTMVPLLLAGTNMIATMPRRLAERAARIQPLVVKPVPFVVPEIVESAQWNRRRNSDPALAWLVARFVAHCQALK